jgi:hypothetical protein
MEQEEIDQYAVYDMYKGVDYVIARHVQPPDGIVQGKGGHGNAAWAHYYLRQVLDVPEFIVLNYIGSIVEVECCIKCV